MGQLINHNSFLVVVVFLWLIAGGFFLRGDQSPRSIAIFIGITVVLAGGFFFTRLEPGSRDPAEEVKKQIGAGKPVLLEFRSQN